MNCPQEPRLTASLPKVGSGVLPSDPASSLRIAGAFNTLTPSILAVRTHGAARGMSLQEARTVLALPSDFTDTEIVRACTAVLNSDVAEPIELKDAAQLMACTTAIASALSALPSSGAPVKFEPVGGPNLGELFCG